MRLLLLSILLVASGCAQLSSRQIEVASDLSNRPFAYVDEQGNPAGFEITLITRIAKILGATVNWTQAEFDDLLPACAASEVDVVAATLGITPERERDVLFSHPYYITRIAIVVRTGAREPTSHEALRGLRVRASRGTTSERAVRASLSDAILVLSGKDAGPVADELASGAIDAAAMDGPDASRLVAASDGSLRELAPLTQERYAFAIAPKRSQLRREIDLALRELAESGELRALLVEHGIEIR